MRTPGRLSPPEVEASAAAGGGAQLRAEAGLCVGDRAVTGDSGTGGHPTQQLTDSEACRRRGGPAPQTPHDAGHDAAEAASGLADRALRLFRLRLLTRYR